jgi:hypothetical protein
LKCVPCARGVSRRSFLKTTAGALATGLCGAAVPGVVGRAAVPLLLRAADKKPAERP